MISRPILLVDNGGTSANYCYLDRSGTISFFESFSYQAVYFSEDFFEKSKQFWKEKSLDPDVEIYFFGTGLSIEANRNRLHTHLHEVGFQYIHLGSDLVIAALATLSQQAGHIAIMGTGSILAAFDGETISQTWGGFGYLLGDEGSGYFAGKMILDGYLNKIYTPEVLSDLDQGLVDERNVLKQVYGPDGKKYIGEAARLGSHFPEIKEVHRENIAAFLEKTVDSLTEKPHVIHFVGSYAYFNRAILAEQLAQRNIELGSVIKAPLEAFTDIELIKNVQKTYGKA